MADLVKVKGLKGKQNKKKWAKNIDVSELLQARARQHDQQIREKFRPQLQVQDDNANQRLPLDPNRFKNRPQPLPKAKYDNRIVRNLGLNVADDPWAAPDTLKHKYKPSQIPAVIIPESGHSYNPRQSDIQKLKDRVIDYEQVLPFVPKQKPLKELPTIQIRHRNKKRRAAQLQAKKREEQKQFRQQLHNLKKIKKEIEEKEEKINDGIKTKQIKKQKEHAENLTGRVRKGKKLGKLVYQYKEYIPEGQHPEKVSKVELNDELMRQRFDSIYRRGIFEARNIKVHRNKRKNIKVKERGFIE